MKLGLGGAGYKCVTTVAGYSCLVVSGMDSFFHFFHLSIKMSCISSCSHPHCLWNHKQRDYCILTLFLNCGLRVSEMAGLNYNDIHSDGTMRVVGKGNKERIVYLNSACIDAYNEYMKVRPIDEVKDKKALFISRNHRRMSVKTIQAMVYKYLEKIGLDSQGYSCHKLRHTAATLMYQQGGVDVRVLKEVLGHENLGTTEIYTHLSSEQMKNAADSNPLAKIKPKKKV